MNSNKKLYNLFLIFVAVSMLFVSVFGGFSVADTNTEKSEKSDDNYLLSDIPDELSDEPPFDAEAVSEKDAEDYRKWAQRDPRWGHSGVKSHGSTVELPLILHDLNPGEGGGIPGVGVKSVDIWRNISGEGGHLDRY